MTWGGLPRRRLRFIRLIPLITMMSCPILEVEVKAGYCVCLLSPPCGRHLTLEDSEVDIQLEGGEVLKPLGGLEVIHTRRHTPDSIGLYSQENKLLSVGDTMVSRGKFPVLPHKIVSTHFTQAVDSIMNVST